MLVDLYKIECLTNLHVGSGDINFDIIDNQVQKNQQGIPTIHSSSLKGALKEHFETIYSNNSFIEYIFGGDGKKEDSNRAGAYSFFEAKLLTRPVRSNVKPYFNATTIEILKDLLEMIETLKVETTIKSELSRFIKQIENIKEPTIFENIQEKNIYVEDILIENKETSITPPSFLDNLVILPFDKFKKLDLPVIARNRLNNGTSENLWYEEVVPSKSKFYFFIAKPDHIDKKDKEQAEKFDKRFENEEIIQIGANKSIGYGFCKVEVVK